MYKRILEEHFGEEQILRKFGEDTVIDTLDFRVVGPDGGWNFVPPAQFTNLDSVGYGRAMLRTVDDFAKQFSKGYEEAISIELSRSARSTENSSTALIFIKSKSDLMRERLHCAVYGAARAIHEYGDRLKNSF